MKANRDLSWGETSDGSPQNAAGLPRLPLPPDPSAAALAPRPGVAPRTAGPGCRAQFQNAWKRLRNKSRNGQLTHSLADSTGTQRPGKRSKIQQVFYSLHQQTGNTISQKDQYFAGSNASEGSAVPHNTQHKVRQGKVQQWIDYNTGNRDQRFQQQEFSLPL